jgi:hypothetical protein
MFTLPVSTKVDRFIPKTKFYERVQISTATRDEFTGVIGRITWLHKISPATMNVPATGTVEELQVFLVELKSKTIPLKALSIIDKTIPYPILFVLTCGDDICYVIQHKLESRRRYYKTEWNQLPTLSFTGTNLEVVYQRIVTSFIALDDDEVSSKSFEEIITTNTQREQLQKDIRALENKIRSERQFSKKVALNTELQHKRHQLDDLS